MRMPFEKLMEYVDNITDKKITLGQISDDTGEPTGRIADAIDACRVLRGERTYISV